VPEALSDMDGLIDGTALVREETMIDAMKLVHRHLGLIAEPSGVVGLSAILEDPARFAGRRVATVLCGGNLTPEQVADWLG
jgi:threonine dehydratase